MTKQERKKKYLPHSYENIGSAVLIQYAKHMHT